MFFSSRRDETSAQDQIVLSLLAARNLCCLLCSSSIIGSLSWRKFASECAATCEREHIACLLPIEAKALSRFKSCANFDPSRRPISTDLFGARLFVNVFILRVTIARFRSLPAGIGESERRVRISSKVRVPLPQELQPQEWWREREISESRVISGQDPT